MGIGIGIGAGHVCLINIMTMWRSDKFRRMRHRYRYKQRYRYGYEACVSGRYKVRLALVRSLFTPFVLLSRPYGRRLSTAAYLRSVIALRRYSQAAFWAAGAVLPTFLRWQGQPLPQIRAAISGWSAALSAGTLWPNILVLPRFEKWGFEPPDRRRLISVSGRVTNKFALSLERGSGRPDNPELVVANCGRCCCGR